MPLAVVSDPLTIAGLIAIVIALLLVDLVLFARGREPTFRESVVWSIGWLALGLVVALPLWAVDDGDGAINYVTVYLIERSLSLDNLFVFLLIFAAFAVPVEHRGRLLFYGIVLALVMRGAAILVGVRLIRGRRARRPGGQPAHRACGVRDRRHGVGPGRSPRSRGGGRAPGGSGAGAADARGLTRSRAAGEARGRVRPGSRLGTCPTSATSRSARGAAGASFTSASRWTTSGW